MDYDSQRPWGRYEVLLDSEECKVKRIFVEPKKRLSYQKHYKREEVWTIVQGNPVVVINGKEYHHKPGDVIRIPFEALHRIGNPTDELVIFIEVQLGSYFGEDDIIRIQDDYSRD